MRKLFNMLLISALLISHALPVRAEEMLSKGDAIALITASDFVKRKVRDFLSWTTGYDLTKVNQMKLVPSFRYIKATPVHVPPDGRTLLELQASIEDPGGLYNINGVRADLSSIGKLPNSMLVDNGLWGDKVAGDGIFTLQSNVDPSIPLGNKELPVAVVNKAGWLAISKTSIVVDTSPQISLVKITPLRVQANNVSPVKISARVLSPSQNEVVSEVYADLQEIGLGSRVNLTQSGKFYSLQTVIPQRVGSGIKNITIYAVNNKGEMSRMDAAIEIIN